MSQVTPRQERILGSLCSGLKSNLVQTVLTWRAWTVAGETKILKIEGLPEDIHQLWVNDEHITVADIQDFVDLGLMKHGQNPGVLLLNAKKIIDFADNFYEFEPLVHHHIQQGATFMDDCHLNERQKQMLTAIARGLEHGYTKTDWSTVFGDGRIMLIWGLNEGDKFSEEDAALWETVTQDDLNAFVDCNLMSQPFAHLGKGGKYRLNKGRIINFVKNGFTNSKSDTLPSIGEIHISGSQNVNIANFNSVIQQKIQNINVLQDDEREEFETLLQKLNEALQKLPADEAEAKAEIETETKALVDAVDNQRSKEVLERKANALIKAAEVVRKVSAEVLIAATAIGSFALKLHYLSLL